MSRKRELPPPPKPHFLRALRVAGVPLGAVETSDPALTVQASMRALNGKAEETPVMQWDCMRGLFGVNEVGARAAQDMDPSGQDSRALVACLEILRDKLPEEGLVFLHNAHRFLDDPMIVQGIWNLRDSIKNRHGLVLMLGPSFILPPELRRDVCLISEALPDEQELRRIIDGIHESAKQSVPEDVEKITNACLSLSAFEAEQALALAMRKDGLDREDLWERKCKMVEQTPGLSVWRGGEKFADIGGCQNAKAFLSGIMHGKRAPNLVLLIEEIEKMIGGAAGDLSGVSQDYLGTLLCWMQDRGAAGSIFIGPPGAGKSMVAKATGTEAGVPTVNLDLGAMKGSLVGQSEQQIRAGLKVADAISQGRCLVLATCNSFANLPPELKRRFGLGIFYFDICDREERKAIWKIYRKRFQLENDASVFADEGWTGAEIRQCCDIADRIGCTLAEASKFIVPVAKSAADTIEALRKQASGKFISASSPGVYQYSLAPSATGSARRFGE